MTTVELPEPQVREHGTTERAGLPFALGGPLGLLASAAVVVFGVTLTTTGDRPVGITVIVAGALLLIGFGILLGGVTIVAPGEARVLLLFGRYVGSVRTSGMRWVNPFTTRLRVSTRIRNHETSVLKVNDHDGNPIEIAA